MARRCVCEHTWCPWPPHLCAFARGAVHNEALDEADDVGQTQGYQLWCSRGGAHLWSSEARDDQALHHRPCAGTKPIVSLCRSNSNVGDILRNPASILTLRPTEADGSGGGRDVASIPVDSQQMAREKSAQLFDSEQSMSASRKSAQETVCEQEGH
eukprot:608430-Pelagomonas_calceolata.AAC.3